MGWSTFDETTDWAQIDVIKQVWEALAERQAAAGGMVGTPYEPTDVPEVGSDIQWGGFTQPYRWSGVDQYNYYAFATYYGRPNNSSITPNTFSFQYIQFWIMGYAQAAFAPARDTDGNWVSDWTGYGLDSVPWLCWQDYRFVFPRAIEIWGVNLKDSLNGGKGWRKKGPRLNYNIVAWTTASNVKYEFGQIVSYLGNYYECLIQHTTYWHAAYPLRPDNDPDCWRLLTEDGQVARHVNYYNYTYTRSGSTWVADPYPYKEADIINGYGWHEPGDYMGWWLLDDIKTALNDLVITKDFSHWINGYFMYESPITLSVAGGAQRAGYVTTDGTGIEKTWEAVTAAVIADYNSTYTEPGSYPHALQMNSAYWHKRSSGPYANYYLDYACWVARATGCFKAENVPAFCERQMDVYYKTGKANPSLGVVLDYNDHGDGFYEGVVKLVDSVTVPEGETSAITDEIGDTSLTLPEFSDPPENPPTYDTLVTGSAYQVGSNYYLTSNMFFRWTGFEYQS